MGLTNPQAQGRGTKVLAEGGSAWSTSSRSLPVAWVPPLGTLVPT